MLKLRKKKTEDKSTFKPDPAFDKDVPFQDYEFNYSQFDHKRLLKQYDSFLLDYKIGNAKLVTEWIEEGCSKLGINPRLIYVLLEKYRGLVTAKTPPAKEIINFGLNIGVGANTSLGMNFEGLDKQIYHCAHNYKRWSDLSKAKLGQKIKCVDGEVEPKNAFAFTLYKMDPYIGIQDIYKKSVVVDDDGVAVEDHTRTEWKKFLFIPYKKVETKVIKQDNILFKKAPFGVYHTWHIWKKLFKI